MKREEGQRFKEGFFAGEAFATKTIHLLECDDWVAVYSDGHKVWENHSCSLRDGLEAVGIPFTREYIEDTTDVEFPERLPDGSPST